ncbi:MAG: hypothetical protein FK734_05965 [Asgard group archaeon]|nr:hypothetical protein [Asgard group archaeon]
MDKVFVKRISLSVIIIALCFFNNGAFQISNIKCNIYPFFTLTVKTFNNPLYLDHLNLIKQQLARIGIDLKIDFISTSLLLESEPYAYCDLVFMPISYNTLNTNFQKLFGENGSLNYWGYNIEMDYDAKLETGINEWLLEKCNSILPYNSNEHIQACWDWQQYFMDKLCPMKPLFTSKRYAVCWSELQGYNFTKGLLQSWGKMSWLYQHQGQINNNEIVIVDKPWADLNPLFQDDSASEFVSNAILDPLIWFEPDGSYWPHLAEEIILLNDTHLRIKCREGIRWQFDPENMFTSEFFDAEDIFFTLYSWAHLSNIQHEYEWIDDMKIVDQYTIDIFIDNDKSTPEANPFASVLEMLAVNILPEHFLNQTQLADLQTPDISHESWAVFATHCFGTGLFQIATSIPNIQSLLTLNENCWRLNQELTSDPSLDWINRFGTFEGGLNQLNILHYTNDQLAFSEFEKGSIDILNNIDFTSYRFKLDSYKTRQIYNVQSKLNNDLWVLIYNMRPNSEFLGCNEPTYYDPNITIGLAVRKAISYAINRDEINTVIHGGLFTISDWPIPAAMTTWCNPNIIDYYYDPDLAYHIFACYFDTGVGCSPFPDYTNQSRFYIYVILVAFLILPTFNKFINKKTRN